MPDFPKPGTPVRGSTTGAPLMALFDLLGRRWAMGIVWQICEHGPITFRALAEQCSGVSPSVLNTRLKELKAAGLVELRPSGYQATAVCVDLFSLLKPMRPWAHRWARTFEENR